MLGAAAGVILAIWYRHEGPQKPVPFYERDEENEAGEDAGEVAGTDPVAGAHTAAGTGAGPGPEAGAEENEAGPKNQEN